MRELLWGRIFSTDIHSTLLSHNEKKSGKEIEHKSIEEAKEESMQYNIRVAPCE